MNGHIIARSALAVAERGRHAADAAKLIPDIQDADIHGDDDVTKVQIFLADTMKELHSVRK